LHIEQDYAFVADPARGYEIIDRKTFTKHYSGNVLLSASRDQQKNVDYLQQVIQGKKGNLNGYKCLVVDIGDEDEIYRHYN
jgi:ABC-type bacteriocin/lantibiotic exporter with double-glycine peptidase domain